MLKNVKDERSDLKLPEFFPKMLKKKMLGDKTKGGFYKKQKSAEGEERFGLDWKTLEYRPTKRAKFAALEMAKNVENTGERLKMLLGGDPAKDKAAAFYWATLSDLWTYAANRIPEISDNIVEIDRAMQLGFTGSWDRSNYGTLPGSPRPLPA